MGAAFPCPEPGAMSAQFTSVLAVHWQLDDTPIET